MKKFNLNHYIYFKLTEHGKLLLNTNEHLTVRVKYIGNDLYKMQAWEFCGIFGEEMQYPGVSKIIETTVYFDDSDLSEVE